MFLVDECLHILLKRFFFSKKKNKKLSFQLVIVTCKLCFLKCLKSHNKISLQELLKNFKKFYKMNCL